MTSKAITLVIGLICFLGSEIKAQEYRFGLQAGIGLSNVLTKDPPPTLGQFSFDTEFKIAYNVNGYFGYKSKHFWGISLEPGYIQKGYYVPSLARGFEAYNLNFNYIHLPVLADFYIGSSIVISIGPEFAYLTKAIAKSKNFSNLLTDNYAKYELSGLVGIQFKTSRHIDTGIRYNHGIKRVSHISFTDDNGQPLDEINQYNQYFQVFVRYRI